MVAPIIGYLYFNVDETNGFYRRPYPNRTAMYLLPLLKLVHPEMYALVTSEEACIAICLESTGEIFKPDEDKKYFHIVLCVEWLKRMGYNGNNLDFKGIAARNKVKGSLDPRANEVFSLEIPNEYLPVLKRFYAGDYSNLYKDHPDLLEELAFTSGAYEFFAYDVVNKTQLAQEEHLKRVNRYYNLNLEEFEGDISEIQCDFKPSEFPHEEILE